MLFITYLIKISFIIIAVERERKLLHLPEAVDDINVNRLLVGRCRCVVEPEDLFFQRVQVVGQEHHTIVYIRVQPGTRKALKSANRGTPETVKNG